MKTKRTKQLNLAVSPSELEAFRESADAAGVETAHWCRSVLRHAAGLGTVAGSLKAAAKASPWELKRIP